MDSTFDRRQVHRKRLNTNNYRREEPEVDSNHIIAQTIICGMLLISIFIIKLVGIDFTDKFVGNISLAISDNNLLEVKELTQTILESSTNSDDSATELLPLSYEYSNEEEAVDVFQETDIYIHTDFAINEELQQEIDESRGEVEGKK